MKVVTLCLHMDDTIKMSMIILCWSVFVPVYVGWKIVQMWLEECQFWEHTLKIVVN